MIAIFYNSLSFCLKEDRSLLYSEEDGMKISEEEQEQFRRAHHLEGESIRQLACESEDSRGVIGKVVVDKPTQPGMVLRECAEQASERGHW